MAAVKVIQGVLAWLCRKKGLGSVNGARKRRLALVPGAGGLGQGERLQAQSEGLVLVRQSHAWR